MKFFSKFFDTGVVDMMRKEYSTGDYVEDRDYIVYLMGR